MTNDKSPHDEVIHEFLYFIGKGAELKGIARFRPRYKKNYDKYPEFRRNLKEMIRECREHEH
jgi:hypothetical protein